MIRKREIDWFIERQIARRACWLHLFNLQTFCWKKNRQSWEIESLYWKRDLHKCRLFTGCPISLSGQHRRIEGGRGDILSPPPPPLFGTFCKGFHNSIQYLPPPLLVSPPSPLLSFLYAPADQVGICSELTLNSLYSNNFGVVCIFCAQHFKLKKNRLGR